MPKLAKPRQREPERELRAVVPTTFPASLALQIQRAADRIGISRSAFIRQAAVKEAERVLALPKSAA